MDFDIESVGEDLIERAQNNRRLKKKLIESPSEYLYFKVLRKLLIDTINLLVNKLKKLEKEYFKSASTESLCSVLQLYYSYKFYADEFDIVDDMMKEYRVYMWMTLNFVCEREEKDLYDFRTKFGKFGRILF